MIQANIFRLIIQDPGVVAIVGSPSTRRDKASGLFVVSAPANSDMPQIIYTQISGNTVPTLDGPSNLQPMRMQFSCYGETHEDAKALARALKQLLVGFQGEFADGTRIDYCSLALELDGYVPIDLEFLFADTSGA